MSEKKQNWFTSIFTDKEWDADASKVVGIVCFICGIVGFFLEKPESVVILGESFALLGISKIKEG